MQQYSVNNTAYQPMPQQQQANYQPQAVVMVQTTQQGRGRCSAKIAFAAVLAKLALALLVVAAVLPGGVAKGSVSVDLPHELPIRAKLAEASFECGLFSWDVEVTALEERIVSYSGSYSEWCQKRKTMFQVAEGFCGLSVLCLLVTGSLACCGSCGACFSRPKALGVLLAVTSAFVLATTAVMAAAYHDKIDDCTMDFGVDLVLTVVTIPIPLPDLSVLDMGAGIKLAAGATVLVVIAALLCFWEAWCWSKEESANTPWGVPLQQQQPCQQQPSQYQSPVQQQPKQVDMIEPVC